jgi:monoamine oxidase
VQDGTNAKVLVPIPYESLKYNSVLTNKMGAYFNSDKKLYNLYFIGSTGAHILKNLSSEFRDAVTAIEYNFKGFKVKYPNLKVAQDHQLSYYHQPVVKSWYEDPYAKGSYSNFGITINKELAQKIAYQNIKVKTIFSPINNKIFFAGEHTTILDEIGTMEAAVESGERIAKLF